jgi:hypothetical protein
LLDVLGMQRVIDLPGDHAAWGCISIQVQVPISTCLSQAVGVWRHFSCSCHCRAFTGFAGDLPRQTLYPADVGYTRRTTRAPTHAPSLNTTVHLSCTTRNFLRIGHKELSYLICISTRSSWNNINCIGASAMEPRGRNVDKVLAVLASARAGRNPATPLKTPL